MGKGYPQSRYTVRGSRRLGGYTDGYDRAAFAVSMSKVWFVPTLGLAAAGATTVLLLSEVPMQKYTDDAYALEPKPGRRGEVKMGRAA